MKYDIRRVLTPELLFFQEPKLSFGYQQQSIDPRDGLTLFGPFDREKLRGPVAVGVVGSRAQRVQLVEYLKRLHQPVNTQNGDIARPFFPGLEATFGISVNFESLVQVHIPEEAVSRFLKFRDSHQRVFNWVSLYADALRKYVREEERPVTVWFVVIQDEIFKFGRPLSKIPQAKDTVNEGLSKKSRHSAQQFLFEELNELRSAYDYEVNFHNQLKARLLDEKIVTQVVRESTIAFDQLWEDHKKVDYERKFDTAKAWNIATTLYYKSGGLPWRLGDIRPNVCYLGLVYKKLNNDPNNRSACCAAQMFIDSGDGLVFRGNIGDWYNPETKEFHITKEDAIQLLRQSMESFREKLGQGNYPTEIFLHAKTLFDDEEWEGFGEAVAGKSKVIGVRIRPSNEFKLFRDGKFCVPRGMAMKLTDSKAFLWTKGYVPRLQTQVGLEVPNPLQVEVTRGRAEIDQVCKDILALTKLNYNACIYADGLPVTLRFADSIGEVLTAGKKVKTDVLPFKHYV